MKASADAKAFEELKRDARPAAREALKQARDRGEELLRDEVPGGTEGLLGKGVTHEDDFSKAVIRSSLIVSAVNENKGGSGVLHLPGGATRRIQLRAGKPYDFARAVAEGTGLFGPRHQEIKPKRGRALLVGVDTVPPGESWIAAPGGKFIVRRKVEGMPPNDFGGRAADRLEEEVEGIVAATLSAEGVSR